MNQVDELYSRVFSEDDTYNSVEKWKLKIVEKWIKRNKFKTIADIGCGQGNYLKPLSEKYNVTGVEPSSYLCEGTLKEYGVINSDIMSLDGSWDGIYCMDVLEHIMPDDIDMTVQKLSTLSDKGLIGIANHSDRWEGVELHLIQEGYPYWQELLEKYYKNVKLIDDQIRFFVFECSR